jgi:predicted Zn-dependent protease
MAWGFRRSAKLGPLRINFSKSGIGYSVGGKGFRVGRTADGRRYSSASIPGTGLYSRQYSRGASSRVRQRPSPLASSSSGSQSSAQKTQTTLIAIGAIIGFIGFVAAFTALGMGIVLMAIGTAFIGGAVAMPKPRFERAIKDAQRELEEDKYEEALRKLLPFAQRYATDLHLLLGLGLAYSGIGQGQAAEDSFKALHELRPIWVTTALYADQQRKNGKLREAIALLQKMTPDEEDEAAYYTMLGNCFLEMNDVQTAIDTFKQGPLLKRKLDENLLGLHLSLGKALEKAGDTKGAIKEYQKVRASDISFEDVEERLAALSGEKPEGNSG